MSMSGRCPPELIQLTFFGQEKKIKELLEKTKEKLSEQNADSDFIKNELKKIVDEKHEGQTAVIAAVKGNRANILKLLIEAGANVNVTMGLDQTPIEYAKEQGYSEIVELLDKAISDGNKKHSPGTRLT